MSPEQTVSQHFKSHLLNDQGIAACNSVAIKFHELLQFVQAVAGESRELSIVRTKLEEACFFAKKAVAVKVDNQLK